MRTQNRSLNPRKHCGLIRIPPTIPGPQRPKGRCATAVAGTNPKLNRKGTGRTGRQISYKIARASYNESATAAMKPIFATSRQLSPATTPANPALQTASVDSDTDGSPNNPNNPNNFSYEKVSDRYDGVRADISKRKVTHRLLESPVPSPLLAAVQVRPAIQMRLNLPRHRQRPANDARTCCGLIFSPATTPHNPGSATGRCRPRYRRWPEQCEQCKQL